MKKLDSAPKYYSPQDAESAAKVLNEDKDGWCYKAKHDPKGTGYSLVEAYDEDGEFVAYM